MALDAGTKHTISRICERAVEYARGRLIDPDYRSVFINLFKLKSFLLTANPGEDCVYFQTKRYPLLATRATNPAIDITATTVWALYEAGIVLPLQCRELDGKLSYIVKRTKAGFR